MEHKYRVVVSVDKATGIAVSSYAGANGVATILVKDNDGKFSTGVPNGTVTASILDVSAVDAKGKNIDLSKLMQTATAETAQLDGWSLVKEIKTGTAKATLSIKFENVDSGFPPGRVVATLCATGRGLASLAFKEAQASLSGFRQ